MPASRLDSAEQAGLLEDHSYDDLPGSKDSESPKLNSASALRARSWWLSLPMRETSVWLPGVGVTVMAVFAAVLLSQIVRPEQPSQAYVDSTIQYLGNLAPWGLTAHRPPCQDPYTMHGYLLHNDTAAKATWIPYTYNILGYPDSPAALPRKRDSTEIDRGVLAMAPPSYASMLEPGYSEVAEAYAADLELLRNKSIIILGCSLDRFFMESICPRLGAEFVNVMDDWHGIFRCTIPRVNLDIQVWSTYGALPEHKTSADKGHLNIFEDRIRDHWLPVARRLNLTVSPDMIIWSSGTWDVLGLRTKYREQDKKAWKEQAMSFQELAWHRMRLKEMLTFIQSQWPGVPTLYRPPTYTYRTDLPSRNGQLEGVTAADIDQINEGIWQLTESAKSAMEANQMLMFAWGEKLIGNNQYRDTTHYRADSYAQWLYAEMLLYYVHYYSMSQPSHCLSAVTL